MMVANRRTARAIALFRRVGCHRRSAMKPMRNGRNTNMGGEHLRQRMRDDAHRSLELTPCRHEQPRGAPLFDPIRDMSDAFDAGGELAGAQLVGERVRLAAQHDDAIADDHRNLGEAVDVRKDAADPTGDLVVRRGRERDGSWRVLLRRDIAVRIA